MFVKQEFVALRETIEHVGDWPGLYFTLLNGRFRSRGVRYKGVLPHYAVNFDT